MLHRVLYLGRFQPLHLGHIDALEQIEEAFSPREIVIVLGSSEQDYQPLHPLTTGERIELWRAALSEKGMDLSRYLLVPVPDIGNSTSYVSHVLRHVPPVDAVAAGSALTLRLFRDMSPHLSSLRLQQRIPLSSSLIRHHMRQGVDYSDMTPKAVHRLLEQWDISGRVRDVDHTGFADTV